MKFIFSCFCFDFKKYSLYTAKTKVMATCCTLSYFDIAFEAGFITFDCKKTKLLTA